MKEGKHKKDSVFELNGGMPPLGQALPLAFQHIVAMIVGCVTPAIIIAGVAGLSGEDKVIIFQSALVVSAFATLLQVFQSLHYKENFALINTAHQLGFYFIKGQSVLNIAGCLNGMKSAANRYVFRIHDEYFHILQLIRNQMNHIIRSAQTAGQCDCNYLLKAVRTNLVKTLCYTLSAWQ